MNIYLALIHHPIRNKLGELVTTSVTNLDIHDISRSCKTFGVQKYFIVTPLLAQKELVNSILGHWEEDKANSFNPDRQNALSLAETKSSFEEVLQSIQSIEGKLPLVVATGANFLEVSGSPLELTKRIKAESMPCLLLFGTGWGLHEDLLKKVDYFLEPIYSKNKENYNHLSVRSAVAIYLDRITSVK